jgi:hypothetical protein
MSADLQIHVIPNEPVSGTMIVWKQRGEHDTVPVSGIVDESVLRDFFSHTIGSRWSDLNSFGPQDATARERAYALISATPSVWVGEVSWLKAALFEDGEETYVPGVVAQVSEIIGERLPVINDELIGSIRQVFERGENTTSYSVDKGEKVLAFLEQHKGLQCFTVSW